MGVSPDVSAVGPQGRTRVVYQDLLWEYRNDVLPDRLKDLDLAGYEVEASDGEVGCVDEATYEQTRGCLVVDIGSRIRGKKRMLPEATVFRIDPVERKVCVRLTRDQILAAPDYDEARHQADERRYHLETSDYYEPYLRTF
jgi:hypothetical protein